MRNWTQEYKITINLIVVITASIVNISNPKSKDWWISIKKMSKRLNSYRGNISRAHQFILLFHNRSKDLTLFLGKEPMRSSTLRRKSIFCSIKSGRVRSLFLRGTLWISTQKGALQRPKASLRSTFAKGRSETMRASSIYWSNGAKG